MTTVDKNMEYTVTATIKEWVNTIIIMAWLVWLSTNYLSFKDNTHDDISRLDKSITKMSSVEVSITEIKKSIKSIDDRTRNIEIRLGNDTK